MRIRNLPRNREHRARKGAPVRPNQCVINRQKHNRVPHWVRYEIKKSIEAQNGRRRMKPSDKKRAIQAPGAH